MRLRTRRVATEPRRPREREDVGQFFLSGFAVGGYHRVNGRSNRLPIASRLSRGDHLKRLFMGPLPPDVDFGHLQSLLPPYSGNREIMKWTPTDWARNELLSKWTKADPAAAAKFKAEHHDNIPQYDHDPEDDAENDG